MTRSLLSAASHVYALGAVAYAVYLIRLQGRAALVGALSLAAGFALQAGAVFGRFQVLGTTPVSNLPEGLAFIGWVLVGAFLVLDRLYRLPALGAVVATIALTLTTTGLIVPGPLGGNGLLGTPGLVAHVAVALGGLAVFVLAAVAAALYLVQERQMKGKRFGFAFRRLPSLDVLDTLNRRLVLGGFVLLSVTLVSGAIFAKARWGDYWSWEPMETLTLGTWVLFAGLVIARVQAGWRGKRVAQLTLAGTAALVASFVALSAFQVGKHGQPLAAAVAVEAAHG